MWLLLSGIDFIKLYLSLLVVSCDQGPRSHHLVSIWKRIVKTLEFYVSQVEQVHNTPEELP